MLYLRAHLRTYFREHLKILRNVEKKMHFTLLLLIHLTVQSRSANEGTFNGASRDALRDFHKNAQEGKFELALKGALDVAPVIALADAITNAQICTRWFI